jgi:hypothetical protein
MTLNDTTLGRTTVSKQHANLSVTVDTTLMMAIVFYELSVPWCSLGGIVANGADEANTLVRRGSW